MAIESDSSQNFKVIKGQKILVGLIKSLSCILRKIQMPLGCPENVYTKAAHGLFRISAAS